MLYDEFSFEQPQCNDVENWCRLCFGRLMPPGVSQREVKSEVVMEEEARPKHEGVLPLLSIVAALDQVISALSQQ